MISWNALTGQAADSPPQAAGHVAIVLSIVALVASVVVPILIVVWIQPRVGLRLDRTQRRAKRKEEAADALLRTVRAYPRWQFPEDYKPNSAGSEAIWESEFKRVAGEYPTYLARLDMEARIIDDLAISEAIVELGQILHR